MPSQFSVRDRIVCLFPGALGDFLCFADALAGLRRVSAAPIRVVARPEWLDLLPPGDYERGSIDDRAVSQLFGDGTVDRAQTAFADAAVVFSWTGHGSNVAARLRHVGVPLVRVFPFRAFTPAEHAAEYYARCLDVASEGAIVHIDEPCREWATGLLRALSRPPLVLHAGSGAQRKNWTGFGPLAERWAANGGAVIEIRGPAEEGRATTASGALVIRQPLTRIAALLSSTPLYVGNDSGVTHLAAALGVPGLALFGDEAAAVHWRPRSRRMEVLQGESRCSACPGTEFCLHRLPLESVEARLHRRWEETQRWQMGQ